eukprot:scaffold161544_cov35-Tisochrysis_lutea.AAC.1
MLSVVGSMSMKSLPAAFLAVVSVLVGHASSKGDGRWSGKHINIKKFFVQPLMIPTLRVS